MRTWVTGLDSGYRLAVLACRRATAGRSARRRIRSDADHEALRRRLDTLEQRVRTLKRAEADLDIRLTTHRAIVTQVALVELAKLTGLTQEDWEEALDGFAAHIQALPEPEETDETNRQFEVILDEVEAFRNRREDRPSPVLRLIRGGKEEP
jgi:hypothetical protein